MQRHWVVTRGRRLLVLGRPCNPIVTEKDSMLPVAVSALPEPGSVSLETTKKIVQAVTRELGSALEGMTMIPTRVDIMDTKGTKR